MEPAETVLKFLRSVGPATEAELYLRLFRDTPPESFAILAVEAAAMDENADAVAMDLRFLKLLELTPVVILGLQEPAAVQTQLETLLQLLKAQGVRTTADLDCNDGPAIVGAVRSGVIPLLRPAAGDAATRWEALGRLLATLRTHKLIFLRQSGGLRVAGERVSLVNLESELEALVQTPSINSQEREILQQAHSLTASMVEHRLSIALTSPLNLLHELFTVRGAGTLLRREAHIERHAGLNGVDRERLLNSLEASFERKPRPDLLQRDFAHCYVESQYRGIALLSRSPFGGYLNKFAVTRQAQGEGIGRDLWRAVTQDYTQLLWRARRFNSVNSWYEQQCDAMYRQGHWTVYTRGVDANALPDAITFALAQPQDFEDEANVESVLT